MSRGRGKGGARKGWGGRGARWGGEGRGGSETDEREVVAVLVDADT